MLETIVDTKAFSFPFGAGTYLLPLHLARLAALKTYCPMGASCAPACGGSLRARSHGRSEAELVRARTREVAGDGLQVLMGMMRKGLQARAVGRFLVLFE